MLYKDLLIEDKLIYGVPIHKETGELSDFTELMLGYLLKYMVKYDLKSHEYIYDNELLFSI